MGSKWQKSNIVMQKKKKEKKNIWNDGDNPIVISKLIKRKIKYLIRYLDI